MTHDLDDARRCTVRLPADVGGAFDVYVFHRSLMRDRVSRWRWALGALGVGTYRQDDTVDITYEIDGESRIAHAVPIRTLGS